MAGAAAQGIGQSLKAGLQIALNAPKYAFKPVQVAMDATGTMFKAARGPASMAKSGASAGGSLTTQGGLRGASQGGKSAVAQGAKNVGSKTWQGAKNVGNKTWQGVKNNAKRPIMTDIAINTLFMLPFLIPMLIPAKGSGADGGALSAEEQEAALEKWFADNPWFPWACGGSSLLCFCCICCCCLLFILSMSGGGGGGGGGNANV